MISSEVQRTLVKSAPELWAELSDPAALARHLGELGEIRITRIEPEQRVEWETCDSDTSGTVVIKPSGWGTKVKLTVTRETVEDEAPCAPASDLHAEPSAIDEPPSDSIAETEPGATSPVELSHTVIEPTPEADASIVAESNVDPAPEPEPQPEPAAEPEPTTAAALELVPDPEPRRGFFARLFGRRRVQAPVERDPLADDAHGDEPVEHTAVTEGSAEPHDEGGHAETAPKPSDAHAAWAAWAAPTAPAPAAEPELAPAASFKNQPEPVTAEPHPPASVEHAFAIVEPAIEDVHATGAIGAPGSPMDSHGQADQSELAAGEIADISAGIKADEEVAAEEVTAVLTGVLDRLGAAHHRPFSRA